MSKLIYLTFNSNIDRCQITDCCTNIYIYLFHYVHRYDDIPTHILYLCKYIMSRFWWNL